MEQPLPNTPLPEQPKENIIKKIFYLPLNITEGKPWKALGIWLSILFIIYNLIQYVIGINKSKTEKAAIEELNKYGYAIKTYRGLIQDANQNILNSAICKLEFIDGAGNKLTQENDTTNFTGYYLFKVPIDACQLTLHFFRNPSDKIGRKQLLIDSKTDTLQTIYYP
ncbi:MAG: hypothetical protein ACK4NY_09340 [Spirosomataceae bacterium]